ncbi:hypothetical protein C3L33_20081, partial [Rhododendron williamsianum]
MARAIDFETEFPKISNSYLSQEQRHQFFEKLKQVIVIVNTEIPGTSKAARPMVLRGAGVIIDKNGTILTSAYLVPDNTQSIRVRREVDEHFWEANREGKMPKHDLAILVPKKNVCAFDFATFDEEERFDIGKETSRLGEDGSICLLGGDEEDGVWRSSYKKLFDDSCIMKIDFEGQSIENGYPDDNEVIHGTGLFFNSNGLIMTAGHVVPENWNSVRFWGVDDQNAQKAEVVYAKYDMDLAILKPKKEYHPDFATSSSEGPLSFGTELFSIGHPRELNFSYVVGDSGDLRVVQINNSHGSSGAPVFDSQGKVVGVIALTLDGFDFAIHFTTLKQFCEQYYETQHPRVGSQKEKNKKSPYSFISVPVSLANQDLFEYLRLASLAYLRSHWRSGVGASSC